MPPGVAPSDIPAERRLSQPRFDPPASGWARLAAIAVFTLTAAAAGLWLWVADDLGAAANLAATAALAAGLWFAGWLLSRRA
jgi:hypothetical protein